MVSGARWPKIKTRLGIIQEGAENLIETSEL
jgi:hypothetical protein